MEFPLRCLELPSSVSYKTSTFPVIPFVLTLNFGRQVQGTCRTYNKMVSLWGSKNNDEEQLDDGSTTPRGSTEDTRRPPSRRSYERREREADERTRLLPPQPRPPHSDGYLDPDDPAVSLRYHDLV